MAKRITQRTVTMQEVSHAEAFVLVFKEESLRILRKKGLTLTEWAVLLACGFRITRARGILELNISQLARDLDMQRQNVSRAIQHLREAGVMLHLRDRLYQINPKVLFRGALQSRRVARRMYGALTEKERMGRSQAGWFGENGQWETEGMSEEEQEDGR